ncbi:MAG: selenium metabolism-associated LysR family transcriptional regulator [Eubacteriales bacterium]|nr:selenium metabolism-associated LysR family transcriptional regulator [Eubacteriales bacterium]
MDFKQLQSYIAVVKYKSFTVAAEKLGISQPTISTHIRSLEEEFNSRLVLRTSKSFEITPRGWEMYECARNILKLRDDMVNRWNGKESRVIQLGVSTIPSAYILPEILPEFGKLYDNVYFAVTQSDSQGIIEAVHKGTYDVGLVGMRTEDELLEFKCFYQDRMVLIAPVNERYLEMKSREGLSIQELLQEPMILREEGSGSRKSANRFFEKMGISENELHVAARMNDQEAIKNLVAGGLGVSIVSEKAVKDYLSARRLLKFELPCETAGRKFYIIYQKDYILKPCVKEFIDYLLNFYDQGGKNV